MADLDELFGPEAWGPIADELKRGEHPPLPDIAQALRGSQPIPHDVRCYIADWLDRKLKRKRGRKPDKSLGRKTRNWRLIFEVNYWIEVCKRAERRGIKMVGGVYWAAIEKVSKETDIPESTIDKIYYPRRGGRKVIS